MHFFASHGFDGTLTSLLSREHYPAPHFADAQKGSTDGAARVEWRVADLPDVRIGSGDPRTAQPNVH